MKKFIISLASLVLISSMPIIYDYQQNCSIIEKIKYNQMDREWYWALLYSF